MHKTLKRTLAGLAVASAAFAGPAAALTSSATPASAGMPAVKTVTRADTLVSATCYHEHQVTRTYYHWVTKSGKYVPYPAGPKVTVTDQTVCHK